MFVEWLIATCVDRHTLLAELKTDVELLSHVRLYFSPVSKTGANLSIVYPILKKILENVLLVIQQCNMDYVRLCRVLS